MVFVLCLCVALSACDGGEPVQPRGGAGSETPAAAPACPNQEEVISRTELRLGGAESADVDGDGSDDDVVLYLDERAEPGCQAFVSIATGATTIAGPIWKIGRDGGLPRPSLFALADLDGAAGYEVVVTEATGASTQFVGAYAVRDGGLLHLEVPDVEGGLFPFGGSVGHIEASDCAGDGRVVVSQGFPAGDAEAGTYTVTRRFYSIGEAGLDADGTEETEIAIADLDRLAEFSGPPFGSCDVAT